MRTLAQLLFFVSMVPLAAEAQIPGAGSGLPGQSSQSSGTSNDRLFFALPNYLTLENAGRMPPLTAAEKFQNDRAIVVRPRRVPLVRLAGGHQPG